MQPRWIVRTAIAVTAWLALALITLPLWAAPRASNSTDCGNAADLLLTTRALIEENLDEPKVRAVLVRMYTPAHIAKWADTLIVYAQRATVPAETLAIGFYTYCTAARGNVDGLLGVRL